MYPWVHLPRKKSDLEESSFVYRGGKQGALFTYLLTDFDVLCTSLCSLQADSYLRRSKLSLEVVDRWRQSQWGLAERVILVKGFYETKQKIGFVWKLLENCRDRKLLRESHIDEEEHWRGRDFWIIDGLCNGQPQDKIFTQYFYGLNWLQCKPSYYSIKSLYSSII